MSTTINSAALKERPRKWCFQNLGGFGGGGDKDT